MDDPSTTPNWLTYGIGAFVGLLTGVFEYYRRKVDKIENCYISKEDFKDYMQQMREDRLQMHTENLDRLKVIGDSMNRTHERIDQLFAAPVNTK